MKRFVILFLVVIMMILPLSSCSKGETEEDGYVHKPLFETSADSVYLYNVNAQKSIYNKGEDSTILRPSSLAQLMTAVVVIDSESKDLSTVQITSSEKAFEDIAGMNVPNINIWPNKEIYTTQELLHAILMVGAYDAAHLLANYYGGEEGGVPAFVERMNQKALEIGMTSTLYTSPSGVDGNPSTSQTTRKDTITLVEYIYTNYPQIMTIAGTKTYTIPAKEGQYAHDLKNRNLLISDDPNYAYPQAKGLYLSGYDGLGDYLIVIAEHNTLQIKNEPVKYFLFLHTSSYSGTEYVPDENKVYTSSSSSESATSGTSGVESSAPESTSSESVSSSIPADEKENPIINESSTENSLTSDGTTISKTSFSDPVIYKEAANYLDWAFTTVEMIPYNEDTKALGTKYSKADFSVRVEAKPELQENMSENDAYYLYMINPIPDTVELKKNQEVGTAFLANSPNSPPIKLVAIESDKPSGVMGFFTNLFKFIIIPGIIILLIVVIGILSIRQYNLYKYKKRKQLARERKRKK